MRIYVIRHGQSEANLKTAHAGWSQVPLTEKGIEQARSVQPRLQELHFDKVIVSDLCRAKQTAENALPGQIIPMTGAFGRSVSAGWKGSWSRIVGRSWAKATTATARTGISGTMAAKI